jgi:hypothetical protein
MQDYLKGLNEPQREAVLTTDGPQEREVEKPKC